MIRELWKAGRRWRLGVYSVDPDDCEVLSVRFVYGRFGVPRHCALTLPFKLCLVRHP